MSNKFAHNFKHISDELKFIVFKFQEMSYIFSLSLFMHSSGTVSEVS